MREQAAAALRARTGGRPATDARVSFDDVTIVGPEGDGLRLRVYQPARPQRPRGCLLFIHGGAFVIGSLESGHARALNYSAEASCVVVSVDYRLAPEHRFPAGVEDCFAALRWVAGAAEALEVDPARVGVAGDSSGACLAAAVALMARDRGGPELRFQLLNYPVLDDRLRTRSMRTLIDVPVWSAPKCKTMWKHYLGRETQASSAISPYAAPLRAIDLSGLPSAYIATCEFDPLRDEGIEYACRLLDAGVSVELHTFAGTYHAFDMAAAASELGRTAIAEQVRALRRALASS